MAIPKITVIIPIYGTEKYIDKCLHSVRGQTFKQIEIICVDDCSPDNSSKIVEDHIKQDKRVVLIRHEKNLGLGGARNTAIRAAKADFIASVDSDDHMSPKMLEILWGATDEGWFDIVCCGFDRVDENDNVLSKVSYGEKQVSNSDSEIDIFTILNPAFWNKLWRKSLFIDNDIFFPDHDFYEDMSTTPRILAKATYVKVINDRLYRYLIRQQSIMGGMSDKHLIDYIKGFEIIHNFLEENGLIEQYKNQFSHYIKGNILIYSKSILNSGLSADKKNQYMRFLILLRITFIENFSTFSKLDVSGVLACLSQEDLHGAYFSKYQHSLINLQKKEELIDRHWREIETKATKIQLLTQSVRDLRKSLDNRESEVSQQNINLKEVNEELVKTQGELQVANELHVNRQMDLEKDKENLINKVSDMQFEIKETELRCVNLNHEIGLLQKELENSKEILIHKQNCLDILEEEIEARTSIIQTSAVLLFAVLTYPVMNKNLTRKLVSKPRKYFKDSKSGFAKKYAALFKIV